METQKFGIENLKTLLSVTIDAANTADEIGHTAGLQKWSHLFDMLPSVMKLGTIKFDQIKAEIKDLDAAERLELEKVISDKLSLQDKSLEAVIEEAVVLVEELATFTAHSIAFVKKVKAL